MTDEKIVDRIKRLLDLLADERNYGESEMYSSRLDHDTIFYEFYPYGYEGRSPYSLARDAQYLLDRLLGE